MRQVPLLLPAERDEAVEGHVRATARSRNGRGVRAAAGAQVRVPHVRVGTDRRRGVDHFQPKR